MKKLLLIAVLALSASWLKAQVTVALSGHVPDCNNNGSITATASGGTAPYTYAWFTNTFPLGSPISTSATLSGANNGYYIVVATDANSVASQQTWAYISSTIQAYPSNVVDATCPLNNGAVTYLIASGGVPPYDFAWSNGQTNTGITGNTNTITGLAAGTYSVIITDANGCIFDQTDSAAYVNSIASFTVNTTSTPANCNDGTVTASITGTGTAPYTYYWNTTPPQTGATATGLNGQTYPMVTVTDADGCTANGYGSVMYGPGALQVYGSISNAICPNNNGSINMTVTNGNPPYSYAWSTGSTTQDLTGLATGSYTLTVTDNLGCNITVVKHIGQNTPVFTNVTTNPTNCSNTSGSASVSVSGGVAPYSYAWGTGQTTASISGIPSGYYGVTVTDANGCMDSDYGYVSIPQSCYNGVSGYVYNDMDGNCALNGPETGLPWRIVNLGGYYTSTDYNGYYRGTSLATNTYTISHTPSPGWTLNCPTAAYTVTTAPGVVTGGNDFYDEPLTLQNDVQVYVHGGLARPGFSHIKYYSIYNNGTTSMNGTIDITHDAQEVFLGGTNVTAYNPVTRTVTVAYNNLAPFASNYFSYYLNFSLPSSVVVGSTLTTTAIAYPVAGDAVPVDNYDTSIVTVVGSYDPNVKEVSPAGAGASGLISPANDHLDYTIHFQNTGTYLAETVVIVDTLDQDLDIASFQVVGSSHNMTWEMSGPGVVTFTFPSIMLPDSTNNEPASHGLVSYRVKQLPALAGGTEIKNTAHIYFDFNAPIVTNTTLNTIEIVGVKENALASGITISPNPAQDKITISNKTKELCKKVEIMDINGRMVTSIIPSGTSIQLPEMASGVYIINAHYNSGIYKEKLVISK
ncbi:MAG: hypothetical protein K0S33_352 [Bacteroidetes bacterium]|jgi:hypothetical protein|nr:hypothetical protein [Bacteroidota bacterium]